MFKKIKKIEFWILACILLVGFVVRLYRFNNPIADWHSWRQADTSAVSWYFVHDGFDVLHPRYFDISNVQSGFDNPYGYRFVEFPIYNIAQAGLYSIFGVLTLEEWGRIVTMISSLLAGLFLYLIVSRHSNKSIGLLAAFFYEFVPFNIYYGRTILPDTSMAMTVLGAIYFFDMWLGDKDKKIPTAKKILYALTSFIFLMVSFLLKPYALFFTLPFFVLAYNRFGKTFFLKWYLWVFVIFSLVPLAAWRLWILQYPEGIPVSAWLFNGNGIRFRPSFFRWILYERVTKLISGYLGVIPLLYGVYKLRNIKEKIFFGSFLLSSIIYVCVIATGNVQHDYYQILIMPSMSIAYAIGAYYLFFFSYKKLPIGKIIVPVCILGLLGFGWWYVKDYFDIDNPSIMAAAQAVDSLTPPNTKVIANYNGDTTLLYAMKRQGWPSFEHSLPVLIHMGASYLILLNPSSQDIGIGKQYKIIALTKQYVIFNLHQQP